jgi:hypothetical protein
MKWIREELSHKERLWERLWSFAMNGYVSKKGWHGQVSGRNEGGGNKGRPAM